MNVLKGYNEATPSAFADWVFKNSDAGRRWMTRQDEQHEKAMTERLRLGSLNHTKIEELKLRLQKEFVRLNSDYEDAFVDDGKTNLSASRLSYRGDSFNCRPDLVFLHKNRNHVIIVERKTTEYHKISRIPKNGWPNWRVQLWCYSFIDEWVDVDRITMVGEVWYNFENSMIPSDKRFTIEKSEKQYEDEFLHYLQKYGGKLKA